MKVTVDKLKGEVEKLQKLVDNYEEIYLNLYHELDSTSSSWRDKRASLFFEKLKMEKLDVQTTIKEMNCIIQIYNYAIDKYTMIGKKIQFNMSNKKQFISRCNRYIDIVDEVLRKYHNINVYSCPNEAKYILSEKERLKKVRRNIVALKEKVLKQIDLVEAIEKEIAYKISKIKIELIR